MVAKITVPTTIKRALNYNEHKLKDGRAECIYAHNFLKYANELNFYEKLQRFENLIALNKRATTNSLHISLNFAAKEKLSKEKLIEVAGSYMEKIGFGEQPYLVYQHSDAGHPHIHIITSNIQRDGKRISLHHLAIRKSEAARQQIEKQFDLVRAEDQRKECTLSPVQPKKLVYGKTETKRAISNVLDFVLNDYRFSSLAEYNAILQLYNLKADRGKEGGIIFNKKGLLYRMLDEKGNGTGVPVKASSLYNNPTLSFLENKFEENAQLKTPFKKLLKTKLDWILIRSPQSLEKFREALEKENISLIIRQNETGIVYGLTYVDHSSRCVFNGSDIGKQYSAKAILEHCAIQPHGIEQPNETNMQQKKAQTCQVLHPDKSPHLSNPLDVLLSSENTSDYIPYPLRKPKKKKRKH